MSLMTTWDQVSEDVRRLAAHGYTAHGNWNLSQVCGHLNDWMRFPMDGYPKAPILIRAAVVDESDDRSPST